MTQIEEFIRYVQRVYLHVSETCPDAITTHVYAEVMRVLRDFEEKIRAAEAETS